MSFCRELRGTLKRHTQCAFWGFSKISIILLSIKTLRCGKSGFGSHSSTQSHRHRWCRLPCRTWFQISASGFSLRYRYRYNRGKGWSLTSNAGRDDTCMIFDSKISDSKNLTAIFGPEILSRSSAHWKLVILKDFESPLYNFFFFFIFFLNFWVKIILILRTTQICLAFPVINYPSSKFWTYFFFFRLTILSTSGKKVVVGRIKNFPKISSLPALLVSDHPLGWRRRKWSHF
jgi:hypothetical protein